MSVLQKGVLTVIAVTAVASALILVTGKNATAEADNASHSLQASNFVDESLHSKRPAIPPNTLDKNVLLKEVLDDEHLQQKSPNKSFVPAFSLSPPPIGPFQVARPNAYGLQGQTTDLSIAFDKKQRAVTIPRHNTESFVAPIMKKMNQLAPQPPQEIRSQPLKPEQQAEKMIAPVNRLVEPQAPVQKTPKRFSVPPVAPMMQRYMYVPVPAQMYQQVPKIPMTGVDTTISKVPATETWQNNPNRLHKNTQQPTLQPNK